MSFPYRSTLGYVALVAAGVVAGQSLMRQSALISEMRAQNANRRAKLAEAERTASKLDDWLAEIARASSNLAKFDLSSVAPPGDAMSWAYDQMRTCASEAGLKLVNVSESNAGIPDPRIREETPWFRPYRLSVELSGTPEAATRFVRCIEDSNSLVSMHHFSVIALRAGEPPMIFATMEWPAWTDEAKKQRAETILQAAREGR